MHIPLHIHIFNITNLWNWRGVIQMREGWAQRPGWSSGNAEKGMGFPRMVRVDWEGLLKVWVWQGEPGKERCWQLGFPSSRPGRGSLVVPLTEKGKAGETATLGKEVGNQEFSFGLLYLRLPNQVQVHLSVGLWAPAYKGILHICSSFQTHSFLSGFQEKSHSIPFPWGKETICSQAVQKKMKVHMALVFTSFLDNYQKSGNCCT